MHILLTGGTGFIGKALTKALLQAGHQLTILTRQAQLTSSLPAVTFCQKLTDWHHLDHVDAVINLAGEPIFDKAWTSKQKQRLLTSRVNLTHQLVNLINAGQNPPHTFISGSACGYYGNLAHSNHFYDESTPAGTHFSAKICLEWEKAALNAQSQQTRVCLIRTGMVLNQKGGALKKMLPLYRLNLAGQLGSGAQYWPWICLADHIQAILFLLKNTNCSGAFNLVAPEPITNAVFNQRLAKSLKRYAVFNLPAFLLHLLLGERSQLLLDNQPLVPKRLLAAGFTFQQPQLDFSRIFAE
ncbi:TIGR01777 family oxidoreductase [[Haemophilus] ducreyi]|uniref:TIGR01777 family oxidoreductase n=1 Tax=Haemophilus ducreyi TaxID=730 RepID=UPI0006557123|nr:TIGR01777 family oxidoreductase [[Haemophilus] ducreyi]AKO44889.1 epimerase [[Haemophilus] ducreyi]AKO46295.1 epimerase [[Haemophilus] ducreyi]AKO47638.1 epimerase [[Haemophilus] ducreyi]AKO49019.1 epimerase [[Haemophilus] ducreyi]ANF61795.1 epimerase [[Haemophilus] ducreyi]